MNSMLLPEANYRLVALPDKCPGLRPNPVENIFSLPVQRRPPAWVCQTRSRQLSSPPVLKRPIPLEVWL
jgi:hypothetical protein